MTANDIEHTKQDSCHRPCRLPDDVKLLKMELVFLHLMMLGTTSHHNSFNTPLHFTTLPTLLVDEHQFYR